MGKCCTRHRNTLSAAQAIALHALSETAVVFSMQKFICMQNQQLLHHIAVLLEKNTQNLKELWGEGNCIDPWN